MALSLLHDAHLCSRILTTVRVCRSASIDYYKTWWSVYGACKAGISCCLASRSWLTVIDGETYPLLDEAAYQLALALLTYGSGSVVLESLDCLLNKIGKSNGRCERCILKRSLTVTCSDGAGRKIGSSVERFMPFFIWFCRSWMAWIWLRPSNYLSAKLFLCSGCSNGELNLCTLYDQHVIAIRNAREAHYFELLSSNTSVSYRQLYWNCMVRYVCT